MKIGIAGICCVGLSNGILISQSLEVVTLDIVSEGVEKISPKEPSFKARGLMTTSGINS